MHAMKSMATTASARTRSHRVMRLVKVVRSETVQKPNIHLIKSDLSACISARSVCVFGPHVTAKCRDLGSQIAAEFRETLCELRVEAREVLLIQLEGQRDKRGSVRSRRA